MNETAIERLRRLIATMQEKAADPANVYYAPFYRKRISVNEWKLKRLLTGGTLWAQ